MESKRTKSKVFASAWVALWLGALGAGQIFMLRYESSSEATQPVASRLPQQSALPQRRATLVMLAHPRCPCTRASLVQLRRIAQACRGQLTVRVLFFRPSRGGKEWDNTNIWRQAQAIPGAQVERDPDGQAAQRFGLSVSGQVGLYDAAGALRFSGGITALRGDEADNRGARAVVDWVKSGRAAIDSAPVYGCVAVESLQGAAFGAAPAAGRTVEKIVERTVGNSRRF